MERARGTEHFRNLICKKGLVIAEFGSSHCPPCFDIERKIEKWLSLHPEAKGVYVQIEDEAETAAQNDVFSSPTVRVYVNGKMTVSESGCFSLSLILEKAERYLELLSD